MTTSSRTLTSSGTRAKTESCAAPSSASTPPSIQRSRCSGIRKYSAKTNAAATTTRRNSPIALERCGAELVADFMDQVTQEWRDEQEAEAENAPVPVPPKDGPLYRIELTPPPELAAPGRLPFDIASGLTHDEVIAERDRLETLVGAGRVVVKLDLS